jgi:ribosomal protein L13E
MEPKVFSRDKTRTGRGFSYLELKKANIDVGMARNLGLRIDKRRRTSYEENIKLLKEKAKVDKKVKKPKAGKKKKKEGKKGLRKQ